MPAARTRLALALLIGLVVLAPSSAVGGDTGAGGDSLTIGVVPQRSYDGGDTAAMAEAGIRSVRVWFAWSQVEAKRGEFDWRAPDRAVTTNAERGLTTLPFLFGTPAWAAAVDVQDCFGSDCIPYAPRSDETRAAFAKFAAAAVARYGPAGTFWGQHPNLTERPIEVWQIWNEPNLSSFYAPVVAPFAYASLVQVAAEAIRQEDPGAEVLLGGLTGTKSNVKRMSTRAFLTTLYLVPGVTESFDGIAIHPYNRKARGAIDQIRAATAVADANGDDADFWITELGWASAGKQRWGLVKSRAGQARLLDAAFEWLIDGAEEWNVRAVYWYSWRDTERGQSVCGWCPWSGLIDRAGHEKPAYEALRELARG